MYRDRGTPVGVRVTWHGLRGKVEGKKISLEAIINVAVLEFIRMDPAARAKVLTRRIPEIEAMFEAEDGKPEPNVGTGEGRETGPGKRRGRAG